MDLVPTDAKVTRSLILLKPAASTPHPSAPLPPPLLIRLNIEEGGDKEEGRGGTVNLKNISIMTTATLVRKCVNYT